jgi:hypothetical protein
MRESRTSGFVRGAHSNMCPYRDPYLTLMTGKLGDKRHSIPIAATFGEGMLSPYLPVFPKVSVPIMDVHELSVVQNEAVTLTKADAAP